MKPCLKIIKRKEMTCWKWFNRVLKDAEIEVTEENKDKIDEIIHHYIGEQARYGRCSSDWRKARKEVQADEQMRQELGEEPKIIDMRGSERGE